MQATEIQAAEWSAAYVNDLPDSAFLYISPGGDKDADGKTTPRSLRHLPVKDANGKVDEAHVHAALSRIPQTDIPESAREAARAHAEKLLAETKKAAPDTSQGARDSLERATEDGQRVPNTEAAAAANASPEVPRNRLAEALAKIAPMRERAKAAAAQKAQKASSAERLTKAIAKAKGFKKLPPAMPATDCAKDDGAMGSGDLASGGALAPDQGDGQASKPGRTRDWHGIKVVVDRPAGFVQRGVGDDGKEWERVYKIDYGYIPNTLGGDGEGLDVFLGPKDTSSRAFWALQQKSDGTFDEYKLLFGFETEDEAKAAYCDHIPQRFLKAMCETSIGMVKSLLGLEPTEVMKAELLDCLAELFAKSLAEPVNTLTPSTARLDEEEEPPAAIGKSVEVKILAIQKADPTAPPPEEGSEQRFILGIVLEPDVVDTQGDTYSAEEIERTAHDWMERFRNMDLQHKVFVNGLINPVESYIARVDQEINGQPVKAGTWVLGAHVVDDGIWAKVKSGALTGFSMNGLAKRIPL